MAGPTIEVTLMTAATVAEPASDEEPRPEIEPAPSAPEVTQTTQEHPSQPERELIQSTSQPNDVEPSDPTDWQAIISTYAEESTVQNIEQERLRDAMWRKTFSVMFAPPDDWLIEDEPYLPDLQFEADKPKRLGIKISENCYLGFPGVDPQTVDSDMPGASAACRTERPAK